MGGGSDGGHHGCVLNATWWAPSPVSRCQSHLIVVPRCPLAIGSSNFTTSDSLRHLLEMCKLDKLVVGLRKNIYFIFYLIKLMF